MKSCDVEKDAVGEKTPAACCRDSKWRSSFSFSCKCVLLEIFEKTIENIAQAHPHML